VRALVTGASGFVGRHLVRALREQGHDVDAPSSREVDLLRDDALEALPAGAYDRIFHLAVWTRAGRFCRERGGDQWVVNSRLNTNVLAWWTATQPQAKLIAFGTSASYAGSGVHVEEHYLDGQPPRDYFAYAHTKRMLLVGQMELGRQHGMRWLHLIPSTVYGPGYHVDGRDLHFVYDLARKIVRAAAGGPEVVLWGDGHQRRELVHVRDVVADVLALADGVDDEVLNLGAGEDYSIREIAMALCDIAGHDFEAVQYDPQGMVGAKEKVLSTARATSLLGERPRVPLREGLEEVVEWARANLEELG
jgi:GDP-L-fucose synthase